MKIQLKEVKKVKYLCPVHDLAAGLWDKHQQTHCEAPHALLQQSTTHRAHNTKQGQFRYSKMKNTRYKNIHKGLTPDLTEHVTKNLQHYNTMYHVKLMTNQHKLAAPSYVTEFRRYTSGTIYVQISTFQIFIPNLTLGKEYHPKHITAKVMFIYQCNEFYLFFPPVVPQKWQIKHKILFCPGREYSTAVW